MTIEQPKFLVDEMLQRLGRWLRAAGYDTVIAHDAQSDYYLLRQAISEGRFLITKDLELAKHRRAHGTVIFLAGDSLEDDAEELATYIDIDWTHSPFTRCIVCNSLLSSATDQQRATIPELSRANTDAAYYCRQCNQVFWDGSHVRRMRTHLADWHSKFTA